MPRTSRKKSSTGVCHMADQFHCGNPAAFPNAEKKTQGEIICSFDTRFPLRCSEGERSKRCIKRGDSRGWKTAVLKKKYRGSGIP